MSRTRTIQILALIAAVICFSVAGAFVQPIGEKRTELQLTLSGELGDAVPPHVRLATTALGPFRGLAASIMWYRLEQMKQEGKFYEANTLAEWITTLQPQFAQVWAFHAWNMAYNISVMTYTPEERWDWVSKGIDLLRTKGVVYNPNAPRVYRELSWIFFHKIGGYSDDMHWPYKTHIARDWAELIGVQADGMTTDEVVDAFRKIPESPDKLSELRASDEEVDRLVGKIQDLGIVIVAEPDVPNEDLLRRMGRIEMFQNSLDLRLVGARLEGSTEAEKAFIDLMRDPRNEAAAKKLQNFLRNKVLIKNYNMDPELMLDLMDHDGTADDLGFGPLDWRHPSAHGLYWSHKGTLVAAQRANKSKIDAINLFRQGIHSMQNLTHYGRVTLSPLESRVSYSPDPRFIEAYNRYWEHARKELENSEFTNKQVDSFDSGHENFLLNSMMIEYLYGNPEKARELYNEASRLYSNKPHNIREGWYLMPMEALVLDQLEEHLSLMYNANAFVDATIRRAFVEGLAENRPDVFERFITLARKMYEKHHEKRASSQRYGQDVQSRMGFGSFNQVLMSVFKDLMTNPATPPLVRARIWYTAPLSLKQKAYDEVYPVIAEHARNAGLDPAKAFPVPEGVEEVRTAREDDGEGGDAEEEGRQPSENVLDVMERN